VARELAAWIAARVNSAGLEGVVFGLSGGVDSALVAAICRRAVGDRALGVLMPCHSDAQDMRDAQAVASALGLRTMTVALDRAYDALAETMHAARRAGTDECDAPASSSADRLAEANLKPRLRMITLYYLANLRRLLVVGTGNRSELYVGYTTKFGDGGVDVMPIAGLLKREVVALAEHLGVPAQVTRKAPTAGLWPGQTDEGELGLTYRELDHYLATGDAAPHVKRRVEELHRASEHKRALPAVPPLAAGPLPGSGTVLGPVPPPVANPSPGSAPPATGNAEPGPVRAPSGGDGS
jgi:NAD+ synthase